ncbi:MAG: hypothetical protein L0Z50_06220 [Verrucomicrobiales bacterium]|nr:hypothetical protein [Verrucomicrobiales bacterium]
MHNTLFAWLIVGCVSFSLVGCIHHEETLYRDVSRTRIEFENDKAARVFYEALSRKSPNPDRSESKTEVSIPLVFEHKQRVVPGENAAFNAAVARCDTNKDGVIDEKEAGIYAQVSRKR